MATNQQKLDTVYEHISNGEQRTWMARLASFVLNAKVKRRSDGAETTLANEVAWNSVNFARLEAEQKATRDVLLTAIAKQSGNIDASDLIARFDASLSQALDKKLDDLKVTLTVAKES